MSVKRNRSPSPSPSSHEPGTKLYRSSTIEDRKSSFTAFYSPSLPLSALQEHPFFKTAGHRVAAWRKPSSQRTVLPGAPPLYETGFDDDGETYAGKKVARILEDENAEGSLVVGRWWGGIFLGPVRFKHIEDVAREAVRKYKEDTKVLHADKRLRSEEDPRERNKLVKELQQRDQNIIVLRELLEEKRADNDGPSNSLSSSSLTASPSKSVNYSEIPLARLRQLDKARDATISWLLKQIDTVEKSRTEQIKPEEPVQDTDKEQAAAVG